MPPLLYYEILGLVISSETSRQWCRLYDQPRVPRTSSNLTGVAMVSLRRCSFSDYVPRGLLREGAEPLEPMDGVLADEGLHTFVKRR